MKQKIQEQQINAWLEDLRKGEENNYKKEEEKAIIRKVEIVMFVVYK